ncbi:MAG: hypothetical protein Q8M96_22870, partial [Rubrivivax sp.]|nr:hypothetical protein [Rubrivivax sp.]
MRHILSWLLATILLAGCVLTPAPTPVPTPAPTPSAAPTTSAGAAAPSPPSTPPLAAGDLPPPAPREFRAAWVATVANIDWPSKPGLPAEAQRSEALAMLERART